MDTTRIGVFAAAALALGLGTAATIAQAPPTFTVERLWPRPLPNHWILGSVTGVAVDAQDRVWVVHRGADSLNLRTEAGLAPKATAIGETCCAAAPHVLAFDRGGALVGRWGGPGQGYAWPQSPGGIAADAKGNVWITAAGPPPGAARGGGGRGGGRAGGARGGAARGGAADAPAPRADDAHVLKFDAAGKFVLQIGKPGDTGAHDSTTSLNRPAGVAVDSQTNEVFVADTGNRRIVVFDADTGKYKRHWGAYGTKPDGTDPGAYDSAAAPAKQFRSPSCVEISNDGMVYVCDRLSNRIQVFRKDGAYVSEGFVGKATLGNGAAWDVAFSRDPKQQWLFVADGQNHAVHILRRDTLQTVAKIGSGGRIPGFFYAVGSVATDSQGAVYTGETLEGKRVQRFVPGK
jgi:DNA-binding beta-propeller fold protein YncE